MTQKHFINNVLQSMFWIGNRPNNINRFYFAFEIFLSLKLCKFNIKNWTQCSADESMIGLIKKYDVTNGRKDTVSICYLLANLMIYKNKQPVKSSIEIYENPVN